MKVTKPVDVGLLQQELAAAGVPYRVIVAWQTEVPGEVDIHDQSPVDGSPIELPPEAVPVIDAHVAPPAVIEYAGQVAVSSIKRTTDDVPLEVFRLPTEVKHIYAVEMRMTAVDATSGTTKRQKAEMTFKRLATSVVQVGSTIVSPAMQDTAAGSWQIQPGIDGTDFTISVRGAAGRVVDWLLTGEIGQYAPDGLPPPPPLPS